MQQLSNGNIYTIETAEDLRNELTTIQFEMVESLENELTKQYEDLQEDYVSLKYEYNTLVSDVNKLLKYLRKYGTKNEKLIIQKVDELL